MSRLPRAPRDGAKSGGLSVRYDFFGREWVNILGNWYAAAKGNRRARTSIRGIIRPRARLHAYLTLLSQKPQGSWPHRQLATKSFPFRRLYPGSGPFRNLNHVNM